MCAHTYKVLVELLLGNSMHLFLMVSHALFKINVILGKKTARLKNANHES